MNSFAKIKQACERIGLPAYPDFNTQGEETYVVYNVAAETPTYFADDAPQAVIADLQAHLYMPADKNFFDDNLKMKRALFDAGFTFPAVVLNTTEENNTVRHIVYEFEDDIDDI